MSAPPTTVVVTSHTHWDREWYLPFEAFRLRLVDVVGALVDLLDGDREFRHFMLDGQTICLEDVLALRPELEPRLRAHVASGRLGIGPWYVLQDQFLVGGESIVRNLAEGMRVARRFGRPMAVGYLPDAFGHIAQMPRILRGFGIDSAVVWRGVGDRAPGVEWRWRSPGGAEVLCLWLPSGYGNAAHLPAARAAALARLRAELDQQAPLARARVLLWMNGVDHAPADPGVPSLLAALRQALPDVEIVHAGLEQAVAAVRARVEVASLPVVDGELRRTGEAPLLPGVLSTRSWQKRAHDRAEALLSRQAEPFAALAGLERGAALRHAWRTLLECQPHDSICGCSIDDVARDVDARLRRVWQVARAVRDEALRALARGGDGGDGDGGDGGGGDGDGGDGSGDTGALVLGSAHPFVASTVARVEVERARDGAPFRLVGPDGEVPYDLVSEWHSEIGTRPTRRLSLRILARALLPHGVRVLAIADGAPTARSASLVTDGDGIGNGRVRVRPIAGGGLEILDVTSGRRVVHTFEDEPDAGDSYNFSPRAGAAPARWRDAPHAASVAIGRAAATLSLRGAGASLHAQLIEGERRVEVELVLDHRARDHRLRARFELGTPTATMCTDTPFGWIERPSGPPPPASGPEAAVATHPMSSLVTLAAGDVRVGVAARGLHEVELRPDGTLLVTLLRAIGWISRSDLASRRGHAGYQLPIARAQGRGRLRFRYAIGFADGDAASLVRVLDPALLHAAAVAVKRADVGERALLSVEPATVRLSTVKRADDGRLVVRLVAPDRGILVARVRCALPVAAAWLSDLDERAGTPLAVGRDGEVAVPLGAGDVATVALALHTDDGRPR